MKILIIFIIVALLALLGLVFGHQLIGLEGRVIIALPKTVIEMTPISTIIILSVSFFGVWLLLVALKRLFYSIKTSKTWLGNYSRKHQQAAFHRAINEMLVGNTQRAEIEINKSLKIDAHGSNWLIAGELALQAERFEDAKMHFEHAQGLALSGQTASFKLAELQLLRGRANEAMNQLAKVEGKIRETKAFVDLKLKILLELKDWQEIQSQVKQHKKLLGDDYLTWAAQFSQGELAAICSKSGAKALQQHWQTLPKKERKDKANIRTYIQLLLDNQLHTQAEIELVSAQKLLGDKSLIDLFKQLSLNAPTKAMACIEHQLKLQPDQPEWLSALAHVAYNSNNFILARKAISKAIQLNPSNGDKKLLAKIMEQQQEFAEANAVYRSLI